MSVILVVDDHALVRDGIRLLLESQDPTIKIVEASCCEEGLSLLKTLQSLELVLLDLGLPDANGYSFIVHFRKHFPETPVVILSASEKGEDMRAALAAGARGFIPKSTEKEVMLGAIHLVLSGGCYFPASMMQAADEGIDEAILSARPVKMTRRQLEVLKLLAQGKPNKAIANTLEMAESTVRVHLTAIFKELEASNRTEAVYIAGRLGLVSELDDV